MHNIIPLSRFIDEFKAVCGMTLSDAIVITDIFDKTKRHMCVRFVIEFSTPAIGRNTKVKLYINKGTNTVATYVISKDLLGTPVGDNITSLLEQYKVLNKEILIMPEVAHPNNLNPEVRKSLFLIVRIHHKDHRKYETYLYNYLTDTKYPIKLHKYTRVDVCDINHEDLAFIIESICKGDAIIDGAIKTRHLENGSVTPEKLDREYADAKEIDAARVGSDGTTHLSLNDRLLSMESNLKEQIESIIAGGGEGGGEGTEGAETLGQVAFVTSTDLPECGECDKLYVATDEEAVYFWDDTTQEYKTVASSSGGDITEIQSIVCTL